MAQVSGTATYWNRPNYDGLLWTADVVPGQGTGTPFLTLLGGLNGGNAIEKPDFDYAQTAEFDFPAAAQPSISETASTTAPAAVSPILVQERNTAQIYQEAVDITYKKLSTTERVATDIVQGGVGYWAKDGDNNQAGLAEKDLAYLLSKIARDANWTFLNGTFVQSTSSAVAAQTRGIITGTTTSRIDALGAALDKTLMDTLFRTVAGTSGGRTYNQTPIIFVNAEQKDRISDIYANQPESWNIGGVNITTINSNYGQVGVVYETMVPTNTVLLAALRVCRPVWITVPGKGRLFEEMLAKNGAAERWQVYGQLGLDYANEKLHGVITNLAV